MLPRECFPMNANALLSSRDNGISLGSDALARNGKQWPRDLEPTTFPLEGWELRYDEHVYLPLVVFPGGRHLGVVPLGKSGGRGCVHLDNLVSI